MPYEIQKPATDKEGLANVLKMACNCVDAGQPDEAKHHLVGLIDDLSPKRVKFCWMTKRAREWSERQTAEGIARYCMENPTMCD
jgi:hypothetical protein